MPELAYRSIVLSAMFPDTIKDGKKLADKIDNIAAESFYNMVEFYFEGSPQENELVRDTLLRNELQSVFLGGFPLKSNELDLGAVSEEERQEALRCAKRSIDLGYYFGSRKVLILSGKIHDDINENRSSFQRLTASIKELCRYAEERAQDDVIQLTLEYFNHKGEPYLLVGPSALAARLADKVGEECHNFELTFDLSHAIQLKEDPVQSLQAISRHVNHIHLANCVTKDANHEWFGDKHPPFGYPGSDVNGEYMHQFLQDIKSKGLLHKDTIVGVEVIKQSDWNEDELYQETTRLFQDSLQSID